MHASQIQGCIVEQRVEKKSPCGFILLLQFRQVRCAMCNALYAKVASLKCTRHSVCSQWRFWSNAVEESREVYGR